jgi:hypothetical protein
MVKKKICSASGCLPLVNEMCVKINDKQIMEEIINFENVYP